ncbi:FmdB family zinc ribbon protein [Chloroflexota bacterium]
MPVYDYQCDSCHSCFEQRQGFDADPVAICPECQGRARRLFRPVPIIYKGSGFYTTDHGRGVVNSPADKKEDIGKETKPDVEAKSSAKTEVGVKSEMEAKPKGES